MQLVDQSGSQILQRMKMSGLCVYLSRRWCKVTLEKPTTNHPKIFRCVSELKNADRLRWWRCDWQILDSRFQYVTPKMWDYVLSSSALARLRPRLPVSLILGDLREGVNLEGGLALRSNAKVQSKRRVSWASENILGMSGYFTNGLLPLLRGARYSYG